MKALPRFCLPSWARVGHLYLLLLVCALCGIAPPWAEGVAVGRVGRHPSLASVTHVRAIYPIAFDEKDGLISSSYALCGATNGSNVTTNSSRRTPAEAAAVMTPSEAALKEELSVLTSLGWWCVNATEDTAAEPKSLPVRQSITWSTLLSPGIHIASPLDTSVDLSPTDLFYACALYTCDMQNELPAAPSASGFYPLPDAFGGLSPATPCCSSTNSTFILFPPAPSLAAALNTSESTSGSGPPAMRPMVQADVLPLAYLQSMSLALLSEVVCAASASASSPTSASVDVCTQDAAGGGRRVAPASVCLLRLMSPRFTSVGSAASGWQGDGGFLFPVSVSLCGTDLSDVVSTSSAALLRRGYTAIIATRDGANSAAFPDELIHSIVSWIAAARGRRGESLLGSQAARRCAWKRDATAVSAFRTGDYLSCKLDASLVGLLPPLTLTVSPGTVIDSANTTSSDDSSSSSGESPTVPCAFTLDLNKLVTSSASGGAGGASRYTLNLYATGSTAKALGTDFLVRYHEPHVVIGATFLEGATLAISRQTSSQLDQLTATVADAVLTGLPVMFLAALNAPPMPSLPAASASAGDTDGMAVCAAAPSCERGLIYYPSLNRCVDIRCIGVFSYVLDPVTMQCSLRPVMMGLFAAFALVLIVGDVVLVWLSRWAERQRQAHVKLVEQVQRKNR